MFCQIKEKMCEYNPKPISVVDNSKTVECCQDATDRLKSLEQSNAALEQELQNLEDQLKLLAAKKDLGTPAISVATSFQID
jgi:predicted nuclease with TOPRIM domain